MTACCIPGITQTRFGFPGAVVTVKILIFLLGNKKTITTETKTTEAVIRLWLEETLFGESIFHF